MIEHRKKLLIQEAHKIHDYPLQLWVIKCIDLFPDYFWTSPASGTGFYHDEEENQEGGLVLHTRRVVRLVEDLAFLHELDSSERDILIASAILHDSFAKGLHTKHNGEKTDVFHPLFPPFVFQFKGFADQYISEALYDHVMLCVTSHSGRWSVTKSLNVNSKLPNLLKIADHMGSRKHIKVKLD